MLKIQLITPVFLFYFSFSRDYYFVSKAEMERDVKNNLFIEAGQFQVNDVGYSATDENSRITCTAPALPLSGKQPIRFVQFECFSWKTTKIGSPLHSRCFRQCHSSSTEYGTHLSDSCVCKAIQPSSIAVSFWILLAQAFVYSEWDQQLGEEDALRQFERCQRQEQSFGDLFTGWSICD